MIRPERGKGKGPKSQFAQPIRSALIRFGRPFLESCAFSPAVVEVNQEARRKLGYWCLFMYAPHAHHLVGESNAAPFLTKRLSAAGTALLALLAIVVSCLAARLGATIVVSSLGLSVLWPPSALLVAAMLLVPRRNWLVLVPAGLAGAAVENLQFGFTLGATGLFFWPTQSSSSSSG